MLKHLILFILLVIPGYLQAEVEFPLLGSTPLKNVTIDLASDEESDQGQSTETRILQRAFSKLTNSSVENSEIELSDSEIQLLISFLSENLTKRNEKEWVSLFQSLSEWPLLIENLPMLKTGHIGGMMRKIGDSVKRVKFIGDVEKATGGQLSQTILRDLWKIPEAGLTSVGTNIAATAATGGLFLLQELLIGKYKRQTRYLPGVSVPRDHFDEVSFVRFIEILEVLRIIDSLSLEADSPLASDISRIRLSSYNEFAVRFSQIARMIAGLKLNPGTGEMAEQITVGVTLALSYHPHWNQLLEELKPESETIGDKIFEESAEWFSGMKETPLIKELDWDKIPRNLKEISKEEFLNLISTIEQILPKLEEFRHTTHLDQAVNIGASISNRFFAVPIEALTLLRWTLQVSGKDTLTVKAIDTLLGGLIGSTHFVVETVGGTVHYSAEAIRAVTSWVKGTCKAIGETANDLFCSTSDALEATSSGLMSGISSLWTSLTGDPRVYSCEELF